MAIKAVTPAEMLPIKAHSNKLSLLVTDIHEAMENEIEYWEFIDFPYSLKTGVRDVTWHAKKALLKDFKSLTGATINIDRIPLEISKVKDEDGNIHVYGHFNNAVWNKLIEEARNKQ